MAVVAAVVVLAGGAAATAFLLLKGSPDTLDHMVPASASVYVTAYLDPGAGQKVNLLRLSRKFPDLRDANKLNTQINQALDQALSGSGLTGADIRPWLGSQIGIAIRFNGTRSSVVFLIRTTDDTATRAAFDKLKKGAFDASEEWTDREHGGVTISVASLGGQPESAFALVDHTALIANDPSFIEDAIDTGQGKEAKLSSTDNFAKTIEPLPGSRLGFVYVDFRSLLPQIKDQLAAGGLDLSQLSSGLGQLEAFTGMGATLAAEPNGVALELSIAMDPSKLTAEQRNLLSHQRGQNTVLAYTPQKTFALLALSGFDKTLQSFRDQGAAAGGSSFQQFDDQVGLSEAIRHLNGDIGVEVGPGPAVPFPGGAFLLGVDDRAAIQAFLDRLADTVTTGLLGGGLPGATSSWTHETYKGVDIASLPLPDLAPYGVRPAYAVTEGMAIIASSPDEVKAAIDSKGSGSTIASAPVFKEAVGSADQDQLFYVDVQAVASAVRNALPPEEQQAFDADAGPNLQPLKAFVWTVTTTEQRTSLRVFTLIR